MLALKQGAFMSDFRRFIVSIVGGLEIFFVIASTILGGLLSAAVPAAIASMTGQGGGMAFLAFLVGALGGFCVSAIAVNISASLQLIEENTRNTLRLVEIVSGKSVPHQVTREA